MTNQPASAAMSRWPRITVITPSFNQARYLRQCIDSVIDQAYPDLQHVVLDGGSTDGTVELLRACGDKVSWRSEPDRGQAAAINEGLRRADGEIVAWLNSDDYYLPGALRRAATCLAEHPEADGIFGRALMVDERGRTIRDYPTFDFKRRDLARKCYVCQPTVFLRRSLVADVGPLNEALDICLDYEWWLRIGRRHRLAFCPHRLAASRQYRSTKTASRRLRALVEAGYLMRRHFGRAPWRWSAKWVVHHHRLGHARFLLPVAGWGAALASARRYRRRFDASRPPSAYGRRLLARLEELDPA
ncbi:MAG: glycosyltransferase family 2 protein [Planctomycetota bacterium]|jgi:glycosyltransferase involved in cell wall biosynthesis